MDLWVREARLFKYGSGTGSNFSMLRGHRFAVAMLMSYSARACSPTAVGASTSGMLMGWFWSFMALFSVVDG